MMIEKNRLRVELQKSYTKDIHPGLTEVTIPDHINGFTDLYTNHVLDQLESAKCRVWLEIFVNDAVRQNYPNLDFKFSGPCDYIRCLHNVDPVAFGPKFENFTCTFNGFDSVGRQFLMGAMYKRGWFDPKYSSKIFAFDHNILDGNIAKYCAGDQERFLRKFVIEDNNPEAHKFYQTEYCLGRPMLQGTIGDNRWDILYPKINASFVTLVSETTPVSSIPYVTEKFVYPVVGKALWTAFAPPMYHAHVEQYFGFRLFDKIFDYSFDQIKNPVVRVVTLLNMLEKFSYLSHLDWHDLYLMEQDIIEFNYDHYMSKRYIQCLEQLDVSKV